MLKVIIEKEIRDIIGSTKFVATFAVCALLILAAFYAGGTRFKVNQAQYEASKAENLRQLEGLTEWLNVDEYNIFLPPHPLATLVSGVSNDIGRTTEVYGRGELTARGSRFNEDPIFAVFRFLDLEFIFQVVLSLFAILLGYNAISGEKERGTLRLSFANAVPRHVYILGKLIGSFAALATSLLMVVSLGCLLLPLMGIPMAGGDWTRLALIVFTGILYFAVFLTMSVCISAMTQRSSSSFLILLVIWIMSVQIIPRASVLMAGRAVDVPSVDELAAEKTSLNAQLINELHDEMANFEVTDANNFMDEFSAFMDSINEAHDQRRQDLATRLNENRYNRQVQQQELAFNLARISPTASLTLASSTLAGTAVDAKRHYKQEATAYQTAYAQFMQEKTGMKLTGGMKVVMITVGEDEDPPEPIDPNEIPKFDYQPKPITAALASATIDMGVLMVFCLLFFVGAFVAFIRYDVR